MTILYLNAGDHELDLPRKSAGIRRFARSRGWHVETFLCRDVPAGEKVYVLGLSRPENMDVYLGRAVTILEPDDPVPADGVLITRHPITDPALKGRESHIHGESTLWLPRPANPLQ